MDMVLYLLNTTRTPVAFQNETASAPSYPALRGCRCLSYRTSALHLQVKELVAEGFTLRYNRFHFFQDQALEAILSQRGLYSRVMLQGNLHLDMKEAGMLLLPKDSVALCWREALHGQAHFEAGGVYSSLDVFITPRLVEQLPFSELSSLQEAPSQGRPLLPLPCYLTPPLREIVMQILDCPYDEPSSRFYFDLKVREYLYVLLAHRGRLLGAKHRFTSYEAEQVHKAREILLARLDQPPLTIRELARQVALNEFKLKAGFKQFFGTGVFECFQQARMEKARHLLLSTDKPIKDICQQAGYPRMTNFITAFRKHFGYTPASLRRNR